MNLASESAQGECLVTAVRGEGEIRLHIEQLGLVPGTKVRVMSRTGGSVILDVRGSRVGIDGVLADALQVTCVDANAVSRKRGGKRWQHSMKPKPAAQ